MASIRRTYLLTEVEIAKLKELGRGFGLSDSDSVRRGIDMLHDYLIKDKLPDGSTVSQPKRKIDFDETPLATPAADRFTDALTKIQEKK